MPAIRRAGLSCPVAVVVFITNSNNPLTAGDAADQGTIHEGVTARALERKGIVSDRCELNRQIRADNALLQALKSLVKKLMDAVKNTVPAIAEAMEAIRKKMIIFQYRLLHIKSGKTQIVNVLKVVRPDLKRYEDIVKQLKTKIRERRTLLDEKKAIPALQILRHRELAQKITALTEDIEELKSEKVLLLNQFNCSDDHSIAAVKQRVVSMESSLAKLNRQEEEYSVELDTALTQYDELSQQAADMATMEVDAARRAIRPDKERETLQQLQATYRKKFDSSLLSESRKEVADLLGETSEPISIRQKLWQSYEQLDKQHYIKGHDQER